MKNSELSASTATNSAKAGDMSSVTDDFSTALSKSVNPVLQGSRFSSSEPVSGNGLKRSKLNEQGTSGNSAQKGLELASASTSVPQVPITQAQPLQLPALPELGDPPFGNSQHAALTSDLTSSPAVLDLAPGTTKQLLGALSINLYQQNSSAGQQGANPSPDLSNAVDGSEVTLSAEEVTGSLVDATADQPPAGVDPAGVFDGVYGLSQDQSSADVPNPLAAQAAPAGAPAPFPAEETSAVSGTVSGDLLPAVAWPPLQNAPQAMESFAGMLKDSSPSARTQASTAVMPSQKPQMNVSNEAALRTASKSEISDKPGSSAFAHSTPVSEHLTAVLSSANHDVSVSPANGASAANQAVMTGETKHSASVTSFLASHTISAGGDVTRAGSPALSSGNGGQAASGNEAFSQDDGGPANTERRDKAPVLAADMTTLVQVSAIPTTPTSLHAVSTSDVPSAQTTFADRSVATAAGTTQEKPAIPVAAPSSDLANAAVNTSKLIQTMGHSEMRVGVRSSEFGDISIHTSATRDSISAQISLDHSELATSLAAHIPEMRTRLGSHANLEVRLSSDDTAGTASTRSGTEGGSQQRNHREESSRLYPAGPVQNSALPDSTLPAINMTAVRQSGVFAGRIDVQA